MKPYMIIEGSSQSIEGFEQKVANALELGYSLAGELIVQPAGTEMKFYQPVIIEEEIEEWDEDEEEDED
jgi:hypothetical protein